MEAMRHERFNNIAIAVAQRDTAVSLASNFLPQPVVMMLQRVSGNDILAWEFDLAFVLQSVRPPSLLSFSRVLPARLGFR